MRIKNLLFVLLSLAFFACGNDVDMQPDVVLPQGTPPPPPPSGFNIIINFTPVGTDGKKAEVRFGISQIMSEDMTIDPDFFSSTSPSNPFLPLLDPYGNWTILAGNTLSQIIIVDTAEFPVCAPEALINLTIGRVRYGSEILKANNFNVVGMNPDGSTSLLMNGTGHCGGSGQPGDVSAKDFLNSIKDNLSVVGYGSSSGSGSGNGWGYWGYYGAYGYNN